MHRLYRDLRLQVGRGHPRERPWHAHTVDLRLGRRALLHVPLVSALGASGCLARGWEEVPGQTVTIATGNSGGVFDRYGEALAAVLRRRLPTLTVGTRPTDASVANVELVAEGVCEIGMSLADTAADAVRGTGTFGHAYPLAALARTYDSYVHLVVRADTSIDDVTALRRRRVGLGSPGSGTRVLATRILQQAGLDVADVRVTDQALETSARALGAGRLDAFFFVSGIPNSAVATLAATVPIRLVDLARWVPGMVDTHGPEYVRGPIPASTYHLADTVETLSVKNYVLADPELPEGLAYAVTRVLFEAQDDVDRIAPGVPQPVAAAATFTSPVELHPGAVRYYRETQA